MAILLASSQMEEARLEVGFLSESRIKSWIKIFSFIFEGDVPTVFPVQMSSKGNFTWLRG